MAVLREKKLYITKNKQYKSRLGRILTQTLTFPKFSYAIRPMQLYGFVKNYNKKYKQGTFSMTQSYKAKEIKPLDQK